MGSSGVGLDNLAGFHIGNDDCIIGCLNDRAISGLTLFERMFDFFASGDILFDPQIMGYLTMSVFDRRNSCCFPVIFPAFLFID